MGCSGEDIFPNMVDFLAAEPHSDEEKEAQLAMFESLQKLEDHLAKQVHFHVSKQSIQVPGFYFYGICGV